MGEWRLRFVFYQIALYMTKKKLVENVAK